MKINSLFIKILVILLILILLINILSFTFISRNIKNEISDRLLNDAMLVLHSLDWAFSPMIEDKQNMEIQRLIENIGASDLAKEIKIVQLDNTVAFTNSKFDLNEDERYAVREILEHHKLHYHMRRENNQLLVAVPIRGQFYDVAQASDIQAALILSVDDKYEAKLVSELRYSFTLLVIITTIILISVIAVVLYILVAKPLNQFREGIKQVANRDYGQKIEIALDGEFRELASAYNYMIDKVSSHTEELNTAKGLAESSTLSKSEFISNISHELLTPINSIIGFNDLLVEKEVDDQKLNKLNAINRSSRTLLQLVNDLLDISGFELDTMKMENEPFELMEVFHMIYDCYLGVAEEKHMVLELKLHESVPKTVLGDRTRLIQLVNNLVNNAFKFTNSGYVRLNATYQNSMLEFRVTDTGVGIEKEKLENIFEAFVQSDNSLSRKYGGTGLGLALSKKIALAMDGTIDVASQLHEGTTFTVKLSLPTVKDPLKNLLESTNSQNALLVHSFTSRLPDIFNTIDHHISLNEVEMVKNQIHLMKGTAGNLELDEFYKLLSDLELHSALGVTFKKSYTHLKELVAQHKPELLQEMLDTKILIVDNDPEIQRFKDYFTDKKDIQITIVPSGLEALEQIFVESLDVLILNVNLPDMSDVELFDLLEHSHQHPYVIGMLEDETEIKEVTDHGYDWFITKPVNRYLVEAKLNDLRSKNE